MAPIVTVYNSLIALLVNISEGPILSDFLTWSSDGGTVIEA